MAAHEEPRPPGGETASLVLAAEGPVTRADIPLLCERLHRVLNRTRADPVVVDTGEFCEADMVTVEALARMQLTARRLGRRIRLGNADGGLLRFLAWTGLDAELLTAGAGTGAVPDRGRSAGSEARRQPEQREQPRGVQEGVERGDPAAGHLDDLQRPG
ncbi:STAS domain-containing protein [Streptomyces radiopugnans]|uniref:STAS domain-containing protein n=1 Tax=Streptomyces radiopugnans TaxID=403935 RepID=A0A1H9BFF7_9ACTN|nr:STAS domain-containing protein [Streptomyces radiopugnans]